MATPHRWQPRRLVAGLGVLACALMAAGVLYLQWSPEGEPSPPASGAQAGSVEEPQEALAPGPVAIGDLVEREPPPEASPGSEGVSEGDVEDWVESEAQADAEGSVESEAESAEEAGRPKDDRTAVEAEPPEAVAAPDRIKIPAIDVDSAIVPVGLKADGDMEVPNFGLAGWYTEAPRPGAEGPSTVVAHVDSRSGPDVFHRLRELARGDEVHVLREDGSSVTFVVEGREQAPKDELPDERIWGWTDEPTLRLITCDGLFDRSSGHYEDNLIVYLSLQSD